ncbi:hypothetical protein DM872_02970 [Pseudomonas taiwanensis]|nr:hypothetical protein [Pseudomonas taiwanensis]
MEIVRTIKQAFETYVYANALSSAAPDRPVISLAGSRRPCLMTVKIKKQRDSARTRQEGEDAKRAALSGP